MEGTKERGGGGKRRLWMVCMLAVCLSCRQWVGVVQAQNSTLDEISAEDQCVGVFLAYTVTQLPIAIAPFNASNQPYSFGSQVTLTNYGYNQLQLWEVSIGFQYDEVIAQADGVLFLSGDTPPGLETTGDTRIVGVSAPNLLTSIDTAGNLLLISAGFNLTGTEFGVNESSSPLPANLTLVNPGYSCKINASAPVSELWVCCAENSTAGNSTTQEGEFFPRQSGAIVMSYDIMAAYTGTYTAQVSILMKDPIGRLDNWNLTWQWTQGEYITTMMGGQVLGPSDQDLCVYGLAAVQYPGDDFSKVMSCSANPVIIDLQPWQSTDTSVAIPHCCRNGTLLPDLIDPAQSRSDFQVTVKKLPPHTAQDDLSPPMSWNIGDGYTCDQPVRVSPSEFYPDALHSQSAVASWQVVCNVTKEPVISPKKCCVSFSAYYNDTVIPCPTCSCGCATPTTLPWNGDACNPNTDALFLPYQAVLLPPSNRTVQAKELARLDHYRYPQDGYDLPCPDNCGISMNWHVYSDYTNGWSARLTLFNWDTQAVVNWSAAVELPKAMAGYQEVYSFNGTLVPDVNEFNNTLFMQGRNGYSNNYLLAKDAKDNPGKLQSIISFDKRKSPGINVPLGDGFPTSVWFNGEECRIPEFPTGDGWRLLPTFQFGLVVAVTILLMSGETIRFL